MSSNFFRLDFWKTYIWNHGYDIDAIPDQTGKVAIVTGANTGLGYATTVALASHGAHVFLACRNKQKALDAIERAKVAIKAYKPKVVPKLEFLELDLNDLNNCAKAAKTFVDKGLPLHLLINNSGIMMTPFELSADGYENQFAVNHLGHFVFTMGLLDVIKQSQPSRIVVLSSIAHEGSVPEGIDFDTLNDETKSTTVLRYGRSKLANVLFAKALARRMENEEVYVNVVHPGWVRTELIRNSHKSIGQTMTNMIEMLSHVMGMSPEQGALTQIYVATSPEIVNKNYRGQYFIPIANAVSNHPKGNDVELQEKLWDFSVKVMEEKVKADKV